MQLRPYQLDAQNAIRRHFAAGARRVMLSLPTGAGKTVVAGDMLRSAAGKGSRVLFVADRTQLIEQTSRHLHDIGISHGIIAGGHPCRLYRQVQVASPQALSRRQWFRHPETSPAQFDLVVVDEAHTQWKSLAKYLLETSVRAIGLSATPMTPGLGKTWEEIVNATTTRALIAQKFLAPLHTYCGVEIDMDGAPKNSAGEWTDGGVADRTIPIIGDIVKEWTEKTKLKFGGPVRTIVFSATVACGEEIAARFARQGFKFEQISYKDPDAFRRRKKIEQLRDGKIDGLISVDALAKGFDLPSIQCVVTARPYRKSVAAFIQAVGRGMRISPETGKTDCLLLDHSGNMIRHLREVEKFWSHGVDALDYAEKKKTEARRKPKEQNRRCLKCGFLMPETADICPSCGAARPRRRAEMEQRGGAMMELSLTGAGSQSPKKPKRDKAAEAARIIREAGGKRELWENVCRLAVDRADQSAGGWRSKSLKWAKANYHELVGEWPDWDWGLEPARGHCNFLVAAEVEANRQRWLRQRYAIGRAVGRR